MKILSKAHRDQTILINMFRADSKNCLVVSSDAVKYDIAKKYEFTPEELVRVVTFFEAVEDKKRLSQFNKICIDDAGKLLSCMYREGQEIVAVAL